MIADQAQAPDAETLETVPASVNAILPREGGRRRLWTDRRVWALLTLLYLALWVSLFQVYDGGQFIDPFNHITYLTSLTHDRDLDFANDIVAANTFDRQRRLELGHLSPNGMVHNNWPPGAALLWAPAYVPVHFISLAVAHFLGDSPPARFAFTPMLTISLMTAVYGYLALWLLYRLARLRHRPAASGAAAGVALACSPLPFHIMRCPASDHGLAAFAIAWWLWLALSPWGAHPRRRGLWLGLAAGVMVLVRWQDAVFGLVGLAALLPRLGRLGRRRPSDLAVGLALAVLGFLSVFGVQAALWKVIDGAWITSPHGPGYIHWTEPQFLALLFSGKGGMLSWHPAMILGFIGLAMVALRRPVLGVGIVAAVLLHLYICAAVDDWHGEWGIGNRRLTELLPLLALGMAELFSRIRGRVGAGALWALLGLLAAANWIFLLYGYRGPVGVFSPLNHDGWATLARFWKPLWAAVAAHPAIALIDNTFFAPWLDLHREPYLAQAGIFAALLPIAVLIAGRRLARTPILQRVTGPVLAVLLFSLQGFLLIGLRAPTAGVAETGAIAQRLTDATPTEAREVRRLTERLLPEYALSPAVFQRLLGLDQRAREIAHESWDPEVGWRELNGILASGRPFDKWVLGALLEVKRVMFTPGQRLPFTLTLGDQGLVERYWPHCWDQRLMQPLFQSLFTPAEGTQPARRDDEAIRVFFDLTDRTPVLWWECKWYEAMQPHEARTPQAQNPVSDPFLDPANYVDPTAPPPAPQSPSDSLAAALAALEHLRVHNPLDLQTLDQMIRTLRQMGRTDPSALERIGDLEKLAREINTFELDRLQAEMDSPLYRRGFLQDRLNYYLAMPYH